MEPKDTEQSKKEKKRRIIRKEKLINWFERDSPLLSLIVSLVATVISALQLCLDMKEDGNPWLHTVLLVLSSFLVLVHIIPVWKHLHGKRTYEYLKKTDKLSSATLAALKEANETKKRYILQSTYGNVPQWHPTDYTKNVLVYDVHEQIRSNLFGLQKLIIDSMEGFSDDNVTVDFVYCYPTEQNPGELPYIPHIEENFKDDTWHLITSGNHSLGGSIKYYLSRKDSFYYYVNQEGYVFCNDKTEIIGTHYITSNKDSENNHEGSSVGLMVELRNDSPEATFVKGILTITTYGRKLYEDDSVSQEDFERIFKENVLNSFRALITSELAQMYIRHVIRDGIMCPKTARYIVNTHELPGQDNVQHCDGRICRSGGNGCSCQCGRKEKDLS